MLSVNHNAKGLTYWIYPSTEEVNFESGKFGNVFQTLPGRDYVFGTNAIKNLVFEGPELDASAWILNGKMMVGVAGSSYDDYDVTINITLPLAVNSVDKVLYGGDTSKFIFIHSEIKSLHCWQYPHRLVPFIS